MRLVFIDSTKQHGADTESSKADTAILTISYAGVLQENLKDTFWELVAKQVNKHKNKYVKQKINAEMIKERFKVTQKNFNRTNKAKVYLDDKERIVLDLNGEAVTKYSEADTESSKADLEMQFKFLNMFIKEIQEWYPFKRRNRNPQDTETYRKIFPKLQSFIDI
jgi:hypothetical protein